MRAARYALVIMCLFWGFLFAICSVLSAPAHGAPDLSQQGTPPGRAQAAPALKQAASALKIDESFVVAKVKTVTAPSVNQQLLSGTGIVSHNQLVELEVLEGPLKGETVVVSNEITDNPAYNVDAKPGKEVILSVVNDNVHKPELNIADYHRVPVLAGLLLVFLAVFLYFGGKPGLKSLLSLVLGIALIGFVLLPMSFAGVAPLLTATLICVAVTLISTLMIAGFSAKALAATLGTIGGVIIAGLAAQIVIGAAPLTGLSTEEAQILRGSVLRQPPVFYSGLLAAGMLIGALGVIMDVAVSIASAVSELAQADNRLTTEKLYEKGMNVGRDIMGTMTNTLVLAYTGSALPLLLLMSQVPSAKLLNLDLVATEVASALTGSLGLVCTIPLTAWCAARFMVRGRPQSKPGRKASAGGGSSSSPLEPLRDERLVLSVDHLSEGGSPRQS